MMRLLVWLLWAATAAAQSTPPKILLPGRYGAVLSRYSGVVDQLNCYTVPAEYSITNLTKLAVYTTTQTGMKLGVAVYPNNDAAAPIASMTVDLSTGGPVGVTGLPSFSLAGGTLYRICLCASTANVNNLYLSVAQQLVCCQNPNLTQLVQAFHPSYVGMASNACTMAVPPTNTGPITPALSTSIDRIPMVLCEQ